jgi:hypothetical protein
MSHHEQQASERGNEQQHHELWRAYNVTLCSGISLKSGTFSTATRFNNSYPGFIAVE